MLRYLTLLLTLNLTACAGAKVEYVPAKCPVPPVVVFEADPVDSLKDDSSLADVAQAYRISRLQWRSSAKDLKLKLDAYRSFE